MNKEENTFNLKYLQRLSTVVIVLTTTATCPSRSIYCMSTSSNGGKVSYIITLQHKSECLTPSMMEEIGFKVNEIVTTRDTAVRYVYIHLKIKARSEDLNRAIQTLTSRGVKGSEIFGYSSVDGNTPSESEHLEDHPGFQTLVEHERVRGSEFSRWTARNINPLADFGYNRLRNKLLARRSSDSATGGGGPSTAGASTSEEAWSSSGRSNAIDGEARVVPPFPDGGSSSGGENGGKRRRSVTPPPPASSSAPALMDSRSVGSSSSSDHIPNVDMFNYVKKISDLLIASLKQQVCASSYSRFPHTFPFSDTLFIHNDNADPDTHSSAQRSVGEAR